MSSMMNHKKRSARSYRERTMAAGMHHASARMSAGVLGGGGLWRKMRRFIQGILGHKKGACYE